MKRWLMTVVVALQVAFTFACNCMTPSGEPCPCMCEWCDPCTPCGCPDCICSGCGGDEMVIVRFNPWPFGVDWDQEEQQVLRGGMVTAPDVYSYDLQYRFICWYCESTGQMVYPWESFCADASMDFYACYETLHRVCFWVDSPLYLSDSYLQEQWVQDGGSAMIPDVYSNDSYCWFDGWYDEATGSPVYDWDLSCVTSDMNLRAQCMWYTPMEYTVYFDAGEHGHFEDYWEGYTTEYSETVWEGQTPCGPNVVPDEGWEFDGWDPPLDWIYGDTWVTAQYVKTHKVTFSPGSHGRFYYTWQDPDQWVRDGDSAYAPSITPDTGWRFAGWDRSFDRVTEDLVVTALYDPIYYTVTFSAGSHGQLADATKGSQSVQYGCAAEDPGIVADEGWKHTGWSRAFDHVTSTMTVTAQYEEVVLRTVTIDGVAETVPDGSERTYKAEGESEADGVQVVCTGWVGTGSFPAEGTGKSVTATITGDSSLVWLYTTNYWLEVASEGPGVVRDGATQEVAAPGWRPAGAQVDLVAVAETGAGLTGLLVNGETVVEGRTAFAMDGPATVAAAFAWNRYTVTFDAGEYGVLADPSLAEQTVEHGKSATLPAVDVRPDCEHDWRFEGWDADVSCVTENLTVSARYAARIYHGVSVNGEPQEVEDGVERTFVAEGESEADGVQVICTGWVGTGSFPAEGTGKSVTATITGDSSLVWLYTTNYWLEVASEGPGVVRDGATQAVVESGWRPAGAQVDLTVVPGDDAQFLGWTAKGLEIVPAAGDLSFAQEGPVTLTGRFAPNHVTVVFVATPHGAITQEDLTVQTIAYGDSATAPDVRVEEGWTFTGWNAAFTNVIADLTVRAAYRCNYGILVDGHAFVPDALVDATFAADGEYDADGMQIVCKGWTGTGSFPAEGDGNSVTVTITNDSTIVWHYETNCFFEVVTDGPGTIRDAETDEEVKTGWVPLGTSAVVTAVPDEGAHFVMWEADGVVTNVGTSVVCFFEAPARVKAVFGKPCALQPSIDTSALGDLDEDDVIALGGRVEGGMAAAYLWRAVQMREDGSYGVATDIANSRESTVQLAAGTWRVEFYACDPDGTWSEPAVTTLDVKPGAQKPDLQLYGEDVLFCNSAGEEIKCAQTGMAVTVRAVLKNGPRAAVEGPVSVCLCEGWVTEGDLASFLGGDARIVAKTGLDGLASGEEREVELEWIVGRDEAGRDLEYLPGPFPFTLVVVSETGVDELHLNNNLTGRLFPIGTEADLDIMRMTLDAPSAWRCGGRYSVSGRAWYAYQGVESPAMGCSLSVWIDGVRSGTTHTTASDGTYGCMVYAPSEGEHTLKVEITDGTSTCIEQQTFTVTDNPVFKPNLRVGQLTLSGSGIYRHDSDYDIAYRGGIVELSATVGNNGSLATTNGFDILIQARAEESSEWEVLLERHVDSGFAVGATETVNLTLPPKMTQDLASWRLRVFADAADEVDESDEGDNTRTRLMVVRKGPDLVVSGGLSCVPSPVVVGETVTVSCAVYNKGLEDVTRPFWVEVKVDERVVSHIRHDAVLPAGERSQLVVEFDSSGIRPGEHRVMLKVDSDNETDELSEDNNAAVRYVSFYPAQADLRVYADGIAWRPEGDVVRGQLVTFSAKIANGPYAIAATNAVVEFSIQEGDEYVPLGKVVVDDLPRGDVREVAAPVPYEATRGFHNVRVTVFNADGQDQNAWDNEATRSFDVEVPVAVVEKKRFEHVIAGDAVVLVGTNSLRCSSFTWEIVGRPAGSAAALVNPASSVAVLTPDVVGRYTVQFCVSDGDLAGEPCEVSIDVDRVAIVAEGICGTLTPSNRVVYALGATPTYAFRPWVWYGLESVKLDGAAVEGSTGVYTFEPLDRSHTLEMRGVCLYPFVIDSDGSGNYVLSPKESSGDFVVTLPPGVSPENVTAAVPTGIRTVRAPEGVGVRIYKDCGDVQHDITEYLDCTRSSPQAGVVEWDVGNATLNKEKESELLKAILDFAPDSGAAEDKAAFDPSSDSPITTAKTVPGLTYTLYESSLLQDINAAESAGDSTVGDGKPWRPKVSKTGGSSRFFTIHVSK